MGKSVDEILERAFCKLYNTDRIVTNEEHNIAIAQAKSELLKAVMGAKLKKQKCCCGTHIEWCDCGVDASNRAIVKWEAAIKKLFTKEG